jgi:hypothetical protein
MDGDFDNKLNLYLRSERAMLDIFVRNKLRQLFFVSLGFVALLTALIMLDIALFFTLKTYFETNITAFILAGSNALLFLIFILFAQQKKHQQEAKALRDIRDFAREQVAQDVKIATDDVVKMGKSVKHVAHDISSIFSGEAFGLAGLVPIIQSILKRK